MLQRSRYSSLRSECILQGETVSYFFTNVWHDRDAREGHLLIRLKLHRQWFNIVYSVRRRHDSISSETQGTIDEEKSGSTAPS